MSAQLGEAQFASAADQLVKEPDGLRHEIEDAATHTLCAARVSDLSQFANVCFFASLSADRCRQCESLATRGAEAQDRPSVG